MTLLQLIADEIDRANQFGSVTAMLEADERAQGYEIVTLDSKPWYSNKDWFPGVISTDGKAVRIVVISAINPHRGAFRRLIDGIKGNGLRPVVIEPFSQMELILRRWGWQPRQFGSTFHDRHTQWAETWGDFVGLPVSQPGQDKP